jgi:hypothetical protein
MGRILKARHFSLYERRILDLIDDAGTWVDFHFDDVESQCGNCVWDVVHKSSSGKYNGTGPRPFTQGVCPVCKGKGRITTPRIVQVKCLINWGATTSKARTSGGNLESGTFGIKAPVSAYDTFRTAKYATVSGIRATIDPPIRRGLGGDVVCETICRRDA